MSEILEQLSLTTKNCTKCGNISEKNAWCRSCTLQYQKEHYWKNRDSIRAKAKIYKEKNKEKILAYKKADRDANKETIKEYRKQWKLKHKDSIPLKKKEYRKKYLKDPKNKLIQSLRGRTRRAITHNYKTGSWRRLLGCSVEECKLHLEKQFVEDMSWDNYGVTGWHIDHIRPICSFEVEELEKAFHYTNLQPLWALDNLTKGRNFEK